MFVSVLKRIESIKNSFTPSELKVANYIKNHYTCVPKMTIRQLALEANTSDAAVIRFLKTIDIDSFGSLKMYLYNEIEALKDQDDLLKDIVEEDTSAEIYRKVAKIAKRTIDDTITYLKFDDLDQSVEMIKHARRIIICGIGASAAVAKDLYLKFLRINLPVHFSMDVHVQMTSVIHTNHEDCVIIISTSGKSREMLEIANMCKKNGTQSIAITQYNKSPLTQIADISLYVASSETSRRIGTMSARIAELTVLDTLFTCLIKQDFDVYDTYLVNTREIMDALKYD